ncbi:MAG: hypothetical protein L0Z48_10870 [candidate division Zixibacteria bacterium]|nr:hypothetical protein [candidate division Zixibacteria bacterium]MCI0597025.1 hypothetical protein [candidate division Zixibacteria bacterium]
MSSPRAEIFERLANQSEQFLSGWAEKEQVGLKTFKRIWRLKELAYRPIAEFPDLAERFRLFEDWLGSEGMELAAAPLTRFQMEEISAALEKLKLFLPRNGGTDGASTDQLSQLAEKFVARLTGREEKPFLDSPRLPSTSVGTSRSEQAAGDLRPFDSAQGPRPTFSAETEYDFVIDRSSEGSAPLDSARDKSPDSAPSGTLPRQASLDSARDKSEWAGTGRDKPPPSGDLSEDFQKLLGYQLEYMREYRKPGEHPFSVIGRLLDGLTARYHLADEVFIAHLLYFLQAQSYPVGPYLEKFRQVKSGVKK